MKFQTTNKKLFPDFEKMQNFFTCCNNFIRARDVPPEENEGVGLSGSQRRDGTDIIICIHNYQRRAVVGSRGDLDVVNLIGVIMRYLVEENLGGETLDDPDKYLSIHTSH